MAFRRRKNKLHSICPEPGISSRLAVEVHHGLWYPRTCIHSEIFELDDKGFAGRVMIPGTLALFGITIVKPVRLKACALFFIS